MGPVFGGGRGVHKNYGVVEGLKKLSIKPSCLYMGLVFDFEGNKGVHKIWVKGLAKSMQNKGAICVCPDRHGLYVQACHGWDIQTVTYICHGLDDCPILSRMDHPKRDVVGMGHPSRDWDGPSQP